MKKGIDVKIINGSMGIPLSKTRWRKAKPNGNNDFQKSLMKAIYEGFRDGGGQELSELIFQKESIIDIDYEEVTDLHSLPELTPEFANQLSEYNKLHAHDYLFNQPEHIAFLGHDLKSK